MLSTDPIDFLLDDSGDMVIPPQLTSGVAGVRANIMARLREVRGEWFLNREDGVAWFANDIVPEGRQILGGKFDQARVRAEFRAAILAAPAVDSIVSFSATFNGVTRKATVRAEIKIVFDDLSETLNLAETF